jgi:hypothetical protein
VGYEITTCNSASLKMQGFRTAIGKQAKALKTIAVTYYGHSLFAAAGL